jgi:tetratricopeptide (TPR) repeat protein
MAAYKFGRGDFNLALRHYRTALEDCLRILGVDHPLTGQMYLDIANVFLRMERREEAIRFLEKAFEIFDTAKHVSLRFFILF